MEEFFNLYFVLFLLYFLKKKQTNNKYNVKTTLEVEVPPLISHQKYILVLLYSDC